MHWEALEHPLRGECKYFIAEVSGTLGLEKTRSAQPEKCKSKIPCQYRVEGISNFTPIRALHRRTVFERHIQPLNEKSGLKRFTVLRDRNDGSMITRRPGAAHRSWPFVIVPPSSSFVLLHLAHFSLPRSAAVPCLQITVTPVRLAALDLCDLHAFPTNLDGRAWPRGSTRVRLLAAYLSCIPSRVDGLGDSHLLLCN